MHSMPKPYLLIAGYHYYPQSDTDDWQGTFETREELLDQIQVIPYDTFFTKGKRKGEIKSTYYKYQINNIEYDWYDIVDLRDWQK